MSIRRSLAMSRSDSQQGICYACPKCAEDMLPV